MTLTSVILSLTRQMLSCGVFNHLSDDEVSMLHHLIVQAQEPLTTIQQKIFISYWQRGNFYAYGVPLQLLQQCNEVLQSTGNAVLEEVGGEEAIELY